MSQAVYAYKDANRNTVMVNANQVNFTGTWLSTGTYVASNRDAVNYNSSQFIAIVDSINVVPTAPPRRNQISKWSNLVVIRAASGTQAHTPDEAYDLAALAYGMAGSAVGTSNGAYAIAVEVSEVASQALQIAAHGTVVANEALRIATSGTNAQALQIAYTALQTAWAGTYTANILLNWFGTLQNTLLQLPVGGTCSGNPEGNVSAYPGSTRWEANTQTWYLKNAGIGSSGWIQIGSP